jgi:hypothetical protein
MNVSTSSYITNKQRTLHFDKCLFDKFLDSLLINQWDSEAEWPNDIEDQKYLLNSLVGVSMRNNVKSRNFFGK